MNRKNIFCCRKRNFLTKIFNQVRRKKERLKIKLFSNDIYYYLLLFDIISDNNKKKLIKVF